MARGSGSTMIRIAREIEREIERAAERGRRAYERAAKADEKEQKRLYIEAKLADAERQNEQIVLLL